MTAAEFATYVRLKTRTNSTTFTDSDILALMKVRQDEIAEAILKADEDILLIPETVNLVANQREYPLDTDLLTRISRVEAKLDGTNWVKLVELDLEQITVPTASEAEITRIFNSQQFNESNPHGARFDLSRKAIYIYSGTISAVTGGLKFWIDTYPAAITSLSGGSDMSIDPSDTTHGIPRPLHKVWAMGVIIDYKESREKPIPLSEREQNYDSYLQMAIESLKHGNMDREVIGDIPYDDGSNY